MRSKIGPASLKPAQHDDARRLVYVTRRFSKMFGQFHDTTIVFLNKTLGHTAGVKEGGPS